MTHYQEIGFIADDEVPLYFIRNKIYTKLHKVIWDLKATDIGISFPNCKPAKKDAIPDLLLGNTIRINSSKNRLDELQAKNWLGGLSGYCTISEITPVPDKLKGYQSISRIRQNMSITRMQKKIAHQKSKGYLKTDEDIKAYEKQYKAKMFKTGLNAPYLELQSTSTGSKYRFYIDFGKLQEKAIIGSFNRFGISQTATIPIF